MPLVTGRSRHRNDRISVRHGVGTERLPADSVPRSAPGVLPSGRSGAVTCTHRDEPRDRSARPPREEIVLRRARMTKAAALLLAGSMALAACASDEENGGGGSEG